MTDCEKEINLLISNAKTMMYNASQTTGESKLYWTNKAKDWLKQASEIPVDFKYPEFDMPEWGTYGT